MFTLHMHINELEDQPISYPDRDDALRKASELWGSRQLLCRKLGRALDQCRVEFHIVSGDGSVQDHEDILEEIRQRPTLRERPKLY